MVVVMSDLYKGRFEMVGGKMQLAFRDFSIEYFV